MTMISHSGSKAQHEGIIPGTMVCRTLTFMWSFMGRFCFGDQASNACRLLLRTVRGSSGAATVGLENWNMEFGHDHVKTLWFHCMLFCCGASFSGKSWRPQLRNLGRSTFDKTIAASISKDPPARA